MRKHRIEHRVDFQNAINTYKMDNVVVERQVLLVDIVIVDEMMVVVVNVVLFKTKQRIRFLIRIVFYVVDIEMDLERDQACYNVALVLA